MLSNSYHLTGVFGAQMTQTQGIGQLESAEKILPIKNSMCTTCTIGNLFIVATKTFFAIVKNIRTYFVNFSFFDPFHLPPRGVVGVGVGVGVGVSGLARLVKDKGLA